MFLKKLRPRISVDPLEEEEAPDYCDPTSAFDFNQDPEYEEDLSLNRAYPLFDDGEALEF